MQNRRASQLNSYRLGYLTVVYLAIAGMLGGAIACVPKMLVKDEPPGVGERAELRYAACAPIIDALEQYRAAKGAYPNSVADLVPEYLPELPGKVNDYGIAYLRTEESYNLEFYYLGPGMNRCAYTPEDEWQCSGAY